MLGKSHVIANVCSLVMVTTAVQAISKLGGNEFFDTVAAPAARYVMDVMSTMGPVSKPIVVCVGLVCFLLGTLLPDIDSEGSLIGRHLHLPIEHRTWTHTIWVVAAFFAMGFVCSPFWWLALGYFLHLFWDALSVGGVCWCYPFSDYRSYGNGARVKRNHKVRIYRVGKASEYVLLTLLVMAALLTLVMAVQFNVWEIPYVSDWVHGAFTQVASAAENVVILG